MDFDKYTERSQGFIQSAQTLALRQGHQRLTPEHRLKVLFDDKEGLAAKLLNRHLDGCFSAVRGSGRRRRSPGEQMSVYRRSAHPA